ncbi:MAG TPA: zinc-dependent metalloprotease [Flavobacterium sp.]|jgi:hypothetical protein
MNKFYLLLLFCTSISFSQISECGVAHESNEQEEMHRREILQQLKAMPDLMERSQDEIAYIPVKVHLIGEDNNTGYLDTRSVNKALARLNQEFLEINIQFYFSGTDFSRYPNSALNDGDNLFADTINFTNSNGHNNAINIYCVRALIINNASAGGLSPISPTQQSLNRILFQNASVVNGKTVVHEFGHYFGLQHTFNGSTNPTISNRELVTRNFSETAPRISANCDLKGDYLCDTPADPFGIPGATAPFCSYNGTVTDANGDTYSPDVTNYMSYYPCIPYSFTDGQYSRMQDGLLLVTNPANNFTLDAPETVQPAPGNLAGVADAYGVTLTWEDNSDSETGYIIERASSTDGPFIAIAGTAENETSLENVPAISGTENYYRIKPSNTKNNYSNISNSILSVFYCSNSAAQSCSFTVSPQFPELVIDDFQLSKSGASLIANLDSGCSLGGTANYYDTFSAAAAPGETLDFTVSSRQGTNGAAYEVSANIYVDWNQDNDFEDENESVFSSAPSVLEVSGSFVVPENIGAGEFRMRAVLSNIIGQITPCWVFSGEMEDYKLTAVSLGNSSVSKAEFVIYPNPVSGILTVQHDADLTIDRLEVTDIYGKKIFIRHNSSSIDTSSLASGMYFLHIYSGSQNHIRRFVRN